MTAGVSITFRPLDGLIPYARNSRTHSDAQVAQIAASIQEFGFTNPVLADDKGVVAGHGRILAARKLYDAGHTLRLPGGQAIPAYAVPVIDCTGWSDAQRRAYVIADNQLALNAGWDADLLKLEVSDLQGEGFDLSLLGFDEAALAGLLAPAGTEGNTDPDEVPPVPVEPVSRPGDVWVMGGHRLICGDSTSADDVARVLGGVKPLLMVTDPPYGVAYDPEWRGKAKNADGSALSTGTGRAKGKVQNDTRDDWTEAWALFPGDVAYVWHGEKQLVGLAGQLQATGFEMRNLIVWGKSGLVVGRGNYHSQHETCWYAVRKTGKGHWAGDRKQTTLWSIEKPKKSETGHGTQKPVECMKRPIENNSSPGQAVYEPFSGSGTTIIAGEMTGRCVFAVEIDPAYVDVAVKRWQDFTGSAAVLEGDGRTFEEVAHGRA